MCNETLPFLMNLYNRKIVTLPVCKICGLAAEDSAHALFWCSKAKEGRPLSCQEVPVESFLGGRGRCECGVWDPE
ncbi:hypothetical protein Q3G72_032376 [Acer saccharum]|nr:hypothetical protein Q3G72_032376 [Acer saccharum]